MSSIHRASQRKRACTHPHHCPLTLNFVCRRSPHKVGTSARASFLSLSRHTDARLASLDFTRPSSLALTLFRPLLAQPCARPGMRDDNNTMHANDVACLLHALLSYRTSDTAHPPREDEEMTQCRRWPSATNDTMMTTCATAPTTVDVVACHLLCSPVGVERALGSFDAPRTDDDNDDDDDATTTTSRATAHLELTEMTTTMERCRAVDVVACHSRALQSSNKPGGSFNSPRTDDGNDDDDAMSSMAQRHQQYHDDDDAHNRAPELMGTATTVRATAPTAADVVACHLPRSPVVKRAQRLVCTQCDAGDMTTIGKAGLGPRPCKAVIEDSSLNCVDRKPSKAGPGVLVMQRQRRNKDGVPRMTQQT